MSCWESLDSKVDFEYCNDNDNIYDWYAFWDSTRSWLAESGYTLFEFGYHWGKKYEAKPVYLVPKLSNPSDSDLKHPFSKYGGDAEDIPMPPLSGCIVVRAFHHFPRPSPLITFKKRITFAQDSLNRHVALRLIKKGGNEYEIAQFLNKQASLSSLEGFEGILAPLDLLDITDHCIVIYPRYIIPNIWCSTIFSTFSCMTLQMG